MKAIILKEFGGTENLIIGEIPVPEISENEILIKVKANKRISALDYLLHVEKREVAYALKSINQIK